MVAKFEVEFQTGLAALGHAADLLAGRDAAVHVDGDAA